MPRTRVLVGIALATTVAGLAGCQSPTDVSFNAVKSNPSPELMGMAYRNVDVERNMALVGDQNLRMMWSDLGRLWLFDAPSTLSPWNTVNTTGQP